jgi:hypothetical protein
MHPLGGIDDADDDPDPDPPPPSDGAECCFFSL